MPTHSLYLTTNIPTNVPEIPNISCVGDDNSIIVTFSPNGDGGSVITSYEYSIDNFIADINSIGVNSSPYTINGLQDGASYNIEIRAVNKNGYGEKTISPDITPIALPSAPSISSITTASNQATITYSAPNDIGGSIIEYYVLTYSSNNFANSITVSPVSTNPITIYSLTNGLTYKFKIQAKNNKGIGAESAPYEIPLPTTPSAPTITSITAGNGSALVNFTAGNDGGSVITNYKYSTNGGTPSTLFNPAQTTSPLTISNLPNGATYQIKIKAVNNIGDSLESNLIPVTLAETNLLYSYPLSSVNASNNALNNVTGIYDFNLNANIIANKCAIQIPPNIPFSGTGALRIISAGGTPYSIDLGNNTSTSYTISVWFKHTSFVNYAGFVGTTNSTSMGLDTGTLMFYANGGAPFNIGYYTTNKGYFTLFNNYASILNNQWIFFCYSYNSTSGELSILMKTANGINILDTTNSGINNNVKNIILNSTTTNGITTITSLTAPKKVYLGIQPNDNPNTYCALGYYSNFKFYDKVLTAEEKLNLFLNNNST